MVPDVSIIKCVWDYRQKHVKKPTSTEDLCLVLSSLAVSLKIIKTCHNKQHRLAQRPSLWAKLVIP